MKSRAWPRPGKLVLVMVALAAFALAGTQAWARGGGSGGHGGGHGGRAGHGGGSSGSHHHSRSAHNLRGTGSTAFYGTFLAGPVYWLGQPYPPAEPVHYIERSEEELQSESVWFYCENDAAYYPYVTKCAGGWVKVAPFTAQ